MSVEGISLHVNTPGEIEVRPKGRYLDLEQVIAGVKISAEEREPKVPAGGVEVTYTEMLSILEGRQLSEVIKSIPGWFLTVGSSLLALRKKLPV